MSENNEISLLWPHLSYRTTYYDNVRVADRAITDLGVDNIVRALCIDSRYSERTKKLLLHLCSDQVVIQHRLDILEDFMRIPELAAELEKVIPLIKKLEKYKDKRTMQGGEHLRNIAWRIEILDIYLQCIEQLKTTLDKHSPFLTSDGLKHLHTFVLHVVNDDTYQALKRELPDFRNAIDQMSSITIGINLDSELTPAEAIFLSVEPKPFKSRKQSLLSNLLGLKTMEDDYEGVRLYQNIMRVNTGPLEQALFKCLEEIFEATLVPINLALNKYTQLYTPFLMEFEYELAFFIGASRFIHKISTAGFPVCKPDIAPNDDRIYKVDQLHDVHLCYGLIQKLPDTHLGRTVVGNDVDFESDGKIFILTGPNQGGKTTYTRAIGLAQLLCQAGLFVLGQKARISPVDWIFTHFSEEEKPNINNGRLGDESKKLAEIFMIATPQSLLLLNESLSSTSPRDSYFLARDLVKGFKMIGCRTVFATHILELAANVDEINRELPGDCKLVSMVAGIDTTEEEHANQGLSLAKRTYKISAGPPNIISFADDIARKHGISFNQIKKTLQQRNVIDS